MSQPASHYRRPPAAGIFAGVLALTLQNLLDLGLEVPGVAMLACLGLGGCLGAAARSNGLSVAEVAAPPLVTVMSVGIVLVFGMRTAAVDRAEHGEAESAHLPALALQQYGVERTRHPLLPPGRVEREVVDHREQPRRISRDEPDRSGRSIA